MAWFKVDDTLAFHGKTVAAGNAAMGLWVRAGSWSMQTLTDGYIPAAIVRQLGSETQAAKLVNAGLWDVAPDGWTFHEWGERQPSAEAVRTDRANARDRTRRAREAAEKKRKGL